MFNTTTTPNANRTLWTAAARGKANARARVNRLRGKGAWTARAVAELLAEYDAQIATTPEGTPDRYRACAARAFVVAASR